MGLFLSVLIPVLLSFICTYWFTPKFIKILELEGIIGYDQMKPGKPKVAEMGAPPVMFGFIVGIFVYIFGQTFIIKSMSANDLLQMMAAVTTMIIIAFIGVLDELTTLMKHREEGKGEFEKLKRRGLKKSTQAILPLLGAIPLIAVNAGVSTITLPFVGMINIGLIYPLILIPIAIIGTSNATNMLAGFNGLQAGIGIVMMSFLGGFAYLHGEYAATLIAFVFGGALLAFLRYNWYPAKIFPGGLDYLCGTVIGIIAIVGNMERFAFLCFMPWFLELLLKARSKFKAQSFGILQEDGTLKAPYEKIYSWTHIIMKLGKFKEWQVSLIIIGIIFVWCSIISVLTWII